jgi:superfamily II DNA/RNA helicase
MVIFCNHRESVERVSQLLSEKGITNTYYHGSMEQREREVALAKFRNGSVNYLVTTDLAARGLDVPNIRFIVHYHLPSTPEIYTHRNGRTARMDASGTVVLILGPEEKLPDFVTGAEPMKIITGQTPPDKPKWTTLFVAGGKKDKINKVDIVGFLSNKGDLKKEDIGLIEVKDFFSFVAVRRSRVSHTLHLIKDQKMKGKKVRIEVAK